MIPDSFLDKKRIVIMPTLSVDAAVLLEGVYGLGE